MANATIEVANVVKHPIVQTELMSATDDRSRMRSFKFGTLDSTTKALTGQDIDNGCIVELVPDAMLDRDLWTAVAPKANSKIGNLALVATPELMYDERLKNLWDFYNKAGDACTGMLFKSGDVFSVTEDGLDAAAAIEVGNIVEVQAGTKMKVVKTATSGSTAIGTVIDIVTRKDGTYIGIAVQ